MKTGVQNIFFTLMIYSPFWRKFVRKNYLQYLIIADFYPETSVFGRRIRLLASEIAECRILYSRYSFLSRELLSAKKEAAEIPSNLNNRIWNRLFDEKMRLAKLRKNSVSPVRASRMPRLLISSAVVFAGLLVFFIWSVFGSGFLRGISSGNTYIAQHYWKGYYVLQAKKEVDKPTDPLFTEQTNNFITPENPVKTQLKLADKHNFLVSQKPDYASRLETEMNLILLMRLKLLEIIYPSNSKPISHTAFFWQELELRPTGTTFIVSTGRFESAVTLLKGELLVIDHRSRSQWLLKPDDIIRKREQRWELIRHREKSAAVQGDIIQVFLKKIKDADETPPAPKPPTPLKKKRLRITLSNGRVIVGQKLAEGKNYFLLNISGSEIQVAKKDISKIDYIP